MILVTATLCVQRCLPISQALQQVVHCKRKFETGLAKARGKMYPIVIELAGVSVDTSSLEMIDCTNPLDDLDIDQPFYPNWVTGNTW